ncbi:hypothetical protein M407DRAFT_10980 [Tulasnella calospora MUT 4182]|uniref:Uncharacterized protein n=1 Tax=Tulasnella calospora MUT 4182 TaxID=1051891 RepID=A0A0C3LFL1_9AGAM|nr:hypothetical protein M407DRAFT_10980 [Tulasnella calospora MUT 4182]
MLFWFATLLSCALFIGVSRSQNANRLYSNTTVVDDTSLAILYNDNSSGQWVADNSLSWDVTKLYLGTVHRGDGNARAQFNFTGIGVKVVIAAQDMPGAWTNISFFVDNTKQGDYIRGGTNANQLVYNIIAFEISGLRNSTHVLDIVGGQGTGVVMYLDYIQYTQLLPTTASNGNSSYSNIQPGSSTSSLTTSSTSTSTSVQSASSTLLTPTSFSEAPKISTVGIIGVGLMVLVIVLLVANLAIWIHRRKRKATKRPRSSETALLKFYHDVSVQGERVQEASHSQWLQTGLEKACPNIPYDHRRYTLLQTPPPSLIRGGS